MLQTSDWRIHPVRLSQVSSCAILPIPTEHNLFFSAPMFGDSYVTSPEDSQWIPPEHQVFRVLVEAFKKVAKVQSICAQFGTDEVVIWTLLKDYDRVSREKVYRKEMEVCKRLGVYDFDFRVSSIKLVPPSELVRAGAIEIYNRH